MLQDRSKRFCLCDGPSPACAISPFKSLLFLHCIKSKASFIIPLKGLNKCLNFHALLSIALSKCDRKWTLLSSMAAFKL